MPFSLPRRTTALALPLAALLCYYCAAALAQQPAPTPAPQPEESPEEVVRVTTELVQTDVTVVDRDGKFVNGLTAADFELKVDGKPQAIQFFERVTAGSASEDVQIAAARGAARTGPAPGGPAVPLDRGRTIIFFVDDFHTSPASVVRTRALLTRFIERQLRQNDRMMITTASGQLGFLQQLTDDKGVLRKAAERLSATRQATKGDFARPQMNVVQAIAIDQGQTDVLDAFIDLTCKEDPSFATPNGACDRARAGQYLTSRAGQIIEQASSVVSNTLNSLRGLLRTSAQFPGRKLVYFVSDGFEVELRRTNTSDLLRRVTDAALRAGVVVYTVDARGLSAHIDQSAVTGDSSPDPSGRLAMVAMGATAETQAPLRTIAGETGGRAILNTDNIEAGVVKALQETSVYYLLAWRPDRDENRGGKFRRLDVSVKGRDDLTLLVQRGFYTASADEAAAGRRPAPPAQGGAAADTAGRRELIAALRSPVSRSAVPTTLTLNYMKTREGGVILTASAAVEIEATPYKPPAALTAAAAPPSPTPTPPTDRAEMLGAVYDAQGKVVYNFQRGVNITLHETPDGTTAHPTHNVTLTYQAPIQPGLYQVRVATRDPKNGRTGSDTQWIEIPDLSKGGFYLSSLFLGNPPAAAPGGKADAPPASQLVVEPDRRFPRNSRVRFLVYAYNAALNAGRPDLAVQVQVFRDDQPVVTAPLSRVSTEGLTEFSRIPYVAEFPLANLPAGRYTLQLTAIDRVAKQSAAQRIKFAID